MNKITACPLDCYDGCRVVYEDGRIRALRDGYTQGFLCPHLNHYEKYQTITKPRYKGKEITLKEALAILKEMLQSYKKDEILHYRGSGNFALMQGVTDHFFASFGATLTDGSLCDGAGEAGIIEGRGSNKNISAVEISKSEVVIFWGRNPHTTSSHLLPLIKDKTIIVIDPIKTKIANMADIFVQIKPHCDLEFVMLLSRFLHIQYDIDEEYLDKYGSEYEDFYELTQSIRVKASLDEMGATLGQIGDILEAVVGKKVTIICGVGIQKYSDGADVMRGIDAFGVMLGLFGKEGCGVAYLGDSKEGIDSPFYTKAPRVSKVDTEFSKFKTVFIQGANPLSQMPNSLRVKKSILEVENVVYFGLYENETSEIADLIIPAKSFLYKDDVRTSYSHHGMMFMDKVAECEDGISEYDLANYLCREFEIEIQSEEFYIKHFKNFAIKKMDAQWYVEDRDEVPYKDGFDTPTKEFVFLEEFDKHSNNSQEGLHLITPKSVMSLNSQFKREEFVYLHPKLGFLENHRVRISSACGDVELKVRLSHDIREDCVLVYSGTKGVNNLTTQKHSLDAKSAIYQENMVLVSKI